MGRFGNKASIASKVGTVASQIGKPGTKYVFKAISRFSKGAEALAHSQKQISGFIEFMDNAGEKFSQYFPELANTDTYQRFNVLIANADEANRMDIDKIGATMKSLRPELERPQDSCTKWRRHLRICLHLG